MTHIESKCPRCGILTLTTTAGNVSELEVSAMAFVPMSLAEIKVEIGDASDDTCRSCGYKGEGIVCDQCEDEERET